MYAISGVAAFHGLGALPEDTPCACHIVLHTLLYSKVLNTLPIQLDVLLIRECKLCGNSILVILLQNQ